MATRYTRSLGSTDKQGVAKEKVDTMRIILSKDGNHHDQQINEWETLWQDNITPWDLGETTPLLSDELHKGLHNHLSYIRKYRDYRVLVPGCGTGYDLFTIAKHISSCANYSPKFDSSFVVVGLDVSPTSLQKADKAIREMMDNDDNDINDLSSQVDIQLKHGDFFKIQNEWVLYSTIDCFLQNRNETRDENLNQDWSPFDFIFDYTFFCALSPKLREKWAMTMTKLIKPQGGKLLTIMFPILENLDPNKPLRGPPFPVKVQDYKSVLEPLGWKVIDGPRVSEKSVEIRKHQELICWWEYDPS
ncbi:hypothetical protein CTEN210_16145 [Chaetoceros tenuissimus]|uniref:Uncharacterized protein n=1 Tax=Chaetoceros tenuissimus TaxID=426638 RepID=A0AAD3DBP2_9STRA|nr:hypothetical protein CTEN210_16145 [Chaetoceros tenuissimus]